MENSTKNKLNSPVGQTDTNTAKESLVKLNVKCRREMSEYTPHFIEESNTNTMSINPVSLIEMNKYEIITRNCDDWYILDMLRMEFLVRFQNTIFQKEYDKILLILAQRIHINKFLGTEII